MGIIGYGNMGSWHAKNINSRIENLEVVAAYDIAPERCKVAEEDGIIVYPSAEELLGSGIDIVLVATPNNLHKYYSILAMESGVDVVCEKPACLNTEELEEVLDISRKTGRFYTVHQNRRFDTDYAVVQKIIEQQMLGKLFFLDSRLYSNRGCSNAWRSSYAAGGGALYDWGIHMIDQILCLIKSKPIFVFSQLQNKMYPEVDDGGHIIIGFENGVKAQIVFDFWSYISEPRWRISGDDGTATINEWFSKEGKVVKANIKEINFEQGCVYTPNGLSKTMWPRPKQDIIELAPPEIEKEPRWEDFYENVLDVIEGKALPLVTHEQIYLSMKVMMAAFESAKTNNTIFIKEN